MQFDTLTTAAAQRRPSRGGPARRRGRLLLQVAALTALLGSAVLVWAQASYNPDAQIRIGTSGSYTGGVGVYGTDGAAQNLTQITPAGTKVIFSLRAMNNGASSDSIKITGPAASSGWTVQYWGAPTGGSDISSSVTGNGFTTPALNPGVPRDIRVEITPDASLAPGSSASLPITMASVGDSSKVDVVQATVTTSSYQPNLLIRNAGESTWTDNSGYNSTGAGQTKTQNSAGQAVTYEVELRNAGNTSDSYKLTGPATAGHWTIAYWDALSAGNDVTSSVTGSGWTVGPLAPGASQDLRVVVTPDSGTGLNATQDVLLTAASTTDATKLDAVKGSTTTALPAVPTGLAATGGIRQISLTWNAVPGATSYKMHSGTVSGSYPTALTPDPTTNSRTDSGLLDKTTRYYVVAAHGPYGDSANSAVASATTLYYKPDTLIRVGSSGSYSFDNIYNVLQSVSQGTLAGTPAVFTIEVQNDGYQSDSFKLTSTAGTANWDVQFYDAPSGGNPITSQVTSSSGWTTPVLAPSVPNGATGGYVELRMEITPTAAATAGSTFAKALTATSVTDSARADAVTASTTKIADTPAAPTSLTSTPGNASVALSWTGSANATGYWVKRADTTGGPYSTINGTVANGTTYTDSTAINDHDYYYVVTAVTSNSAQSALSNEAHAKPQAPPATPLGLRATPGNARVTLDWTASDTADTYTLKWSATQGGPYTPISGLTGTSYLHQQPAGQTDADPKNNTTYYYVITASTVGGESSPSGEVSATPQAPPDAITDLTATPGNAQVTLAWGAKDRATGYAVERAIHQGGPYTTLTTVTGTGYTDVPPANLYNGDPVNGTTYYYVVVANGVGGPSDPSNEANATPQAQPNAPGAPSFSEITSSSVKVTAPALPTPDRGATLTLQSKGAADATAQYTDVTGGTGLSGGAVTPVTGLDSDTVYLFRYRAHNISGDSYGPGRSVRTLGTPPAAPEGLTATAGDGLVLVEWQPVDGATQYYLKVSSDGGATWTPVNLIGTADTYLEQSGLTDGTEYCYKVAAARGTLNGPDSAEACATPDSGNPEPTPSATPAPTTEPTATPAPVTLDAEVRNAALGDDYVGRTVINLTGDGQTAQRMVCPTYISRYWVRINNDSSFSTTLRVLAPQAPNGWTVTYSDAPDGEGHGITADVTNAGWTTPEIAPGQSTTIEVQVVADLTVPDGALLDLPVLVFSDYDQQAADVVRAVTTKHSPTTDAQIRRPFDDGYIGDDVYNLDGTNQSLALAMVAGASDTYLLRVQNDQPTPDHFKVTGPSTAGGVILHYFDAEQDGNDITDAVTGDGWITDEIQPGSSFDAVRVEVTTDASMTASRDLLFHVCSNSDPNKADVVKASLQLQSIAKLQYSSDGGQTWTDAPTGDGEHATVPQGVSLGLRAVKGDPNADWPQAGDPDDWKPVWDNTGEPNLGEEIYVIFDQASTSDTDLRTVSAECGNSKSIKIRVLPPPVDHVDVYSDSGSLLVSGATATPATTTLTASVQDASGQPMPGVVLRFTSVYDDGAAAGEINGAGTSDDIATTGSDGKATATLTAGARSGTAHVTVQVDGQTPTTETTAEQDVTFRDASYNVTYGDWQLVDGTQQRSCTITLMDFGQPLAGLPVQLTSTVNNADGTPATDLASAAPLASTSGTTDANGTYTTTQSWTPTDDTLLPDDYQIVVAPAQP